MKDLEERIAKEVYSVDEDCMVDRTTQPHDLGTFDLDLLYPNAPKENDRELWLYFGTARTLSGLKTKLKQLTPALLRSDYAKDLKYRIVKSTTGQILEEGEVK